MNKKLILIELYETLRRLVDILRLDKNCQWTNKFENDLNLCKHIININYSKGDLYDLSQSIMYVFQGMSSFNDYFPAMYEPTTGRYQQLPGTEDFAIISEKVFYLAKELRTPE